MPRIIQSLDISNVQLLDKIFTLMSFAVKYLTRSIKEDLANFYQIYSELLSHKNKFVRKFSAQAFCYVVRKMPLQGALLQIILKPLMDATDRVMDQVLGVSELLFEVAYGAAEGLHSKAKEVMVQVLCLERSDKAKLVVRCMLQKLINEVDTEKHQSIYDTLCQTLDWKENAEDLAILLEIFKDTIKLKYGRRVPHYGVATIFECLTFILSAAQVPKTSAYPSELKVAIAETMAMFFYFKHVMILGLFQKSQLDINTSKNLFNHHIYNLPSSQDVLSIMISYFNLFIHSPAKVVDVVYEKKADSVDWAKLFGLKQVGSNQMEFTQESHRDKLVVLIKSFNQFLLKKLQDPTISGSNKVELVAIFERLAAQLGDSVIIDLASKVKEPLEKSIYALFTEAKSPIEQFVLHKFISRCRVQSTGYLYQSISKLKGEQGYGSITIRKEFDEALTENMVIKNYSLDRTAIDTLKNCAIDLFELNNIGREVGIPSQIHALRALFIKRNSKASSQVLIGLLNANPDDIVILRAFNSVSLDAPLKITEHQVLFDKLSKNLMKNQRDVRIQTLRALCTKFERLESKLSTDEQPMRCDVLDNLLQCEELELTFKTEKAKLLQIDRVKAQLENDSVPNEYLLPVLNYLVGTFWVRFTPLFDRVQQTIRVLMREHSDVFAPKLFHLIKNVNFLTQVAHSNDTLTALLVEKPSHEEDKSIVRTAFVSETRLGEDFMDVKDFFYNLVKSLCMQTVFQSKKLRGEFFSELFYPFIENEYTILNFPQNTRKSGELLDKMTLANMVDSEDFKSFRRQAYAKMYAFIELLVQAESLTKAPRVADLQTLMLRMLNTSDTKLQKHVLDVLLKTDAQGVLRTYRKMLEGFTDDIKFKDMIQVMNFGSNVSSGGAASGDNEEQGKQEKNLPKVASEHRLRVLPVVVKLLLSKLIKKKGQIKQKTVHQRRHIVYQFMSSLAENDEEMQVFMDEMLFSIGIQISEQFPSQSELRLRLASASFSGYLNFIGSLEVIIKQMGSKLVDNSYLYKLASIFTEILYLTKVFTKHLKLSLEESKSLFDEPLVKEDAEEEDSDIDSDEDMPEEPVTSTKDALYRFVGHQSKMCLKKGLTLIKQLYSKYSNLPPFLTSFTEQLNIAFIKELLPTFTTNYITDRSQLIEVITTSWSQHNPAAYLQYPDIMHALLKMLGEPKIQSEVYETLLQMLKTLILKCSADGNLGVGFLVKKQTQESEDEDMVQPATKEDQLLAQKVMTTFVSPISQSLQSFCAHHLSELKNTLIQKTSNNKKHHKVSMPRKPNAHDIKNQTIKDLIFVMSEIAKYLPAGDAHNQNFLDMIVSVLSMKNLHQSDYATSYYEELLQFGVQSLPAIIDKLHPEALQQSTQIDKLFQLFLVMRHLRIRNTLAQGLLGSSLGAFVKPEVLQIVADLNKLKRGAADLELDYDCAIKTIETIIENQEQFEQTLSAIELQAITYSVLFLIQNEEFSVRDFACHYVKQVLLERCLKTSPSLALLSILEGVILRNIARVGDEMILKSILDVLRHYITYLKTEDQPLAAIGFKSQLASLAPLVNLKDDNDDFFASFLAIKMKNRQKALRMLSSRLEAVANYKAIQSIVMPMVNYIIFGDKSQKSNRRNTITYSREEKRGTLEEALNVYQSLAMTLSWPDYFRLLKTLLFKLNRVTVRQSMSRTDNSVDEDLISQEKIVVKCICRVLNGFHFDGIQDALTLYLKKGDTMLPQATDNTLGKELQDILKQHTNEEQEIELDIEEEEVPQEADVAEAAQITDIQQKIYQKVLPVLERHMSDAATSVEKKGKEDQTETPTIRSYVVVSIMKAIRKLPVEIFQNQFRKLVSTIVSKGLRQRDIACRDKGRKALLKLIEELSPRPQVLHVVFSELKEQLQKAGYQLHTFVFTVHFLLQHLHEKKLLKASDISTAIIELLGEKFLEELFLSNSGVDGALEDLEKLKIKESKSKKAIPVFEMFAQYMDFKQSFFTLIAPVVKTLEENPTITKIQMCEELLNRLSNSLLKNESVVRDELLMFLYTIIQRGIGMAVKVKINGDKGVTRDYGAKAKDIFLKTKQEYKEMTYSVEMRWRKTGQQLDDKKTQEICGRVLGAFGLQCLKRALKQTSIVIKPSKDEEAQEEVGDDLRAQLDPFVSLLHEAFRTYHNPIIVTTLHVLGQIIPLNLPTFKELMKKFLNKIFKLFETTSSSSDLDFLNSLFKCTSELIRTYATYQDLSQVQVKTLISIVKQHIGVASTQGNVFSCLKAIVYRKFMSADLYDLMEQVQELMITSIAKSTRSVCASIFTQFLLEYPLEQSRVEQHINHLLKNLGYFDSEGRLQVLDVLNSLVERFPKELLDQYAELIFFTLVLRTVNETNAKVRERVLQVAKRLTSKCSPAKAKTLFNTVLTMQPSDQQDPGKRFQLAQAKQLILGVFIESQKQSAQLIFEQFLSLVQEEALKLVEENERFLESRKGQESEDEEGFDDTVKNSEMKGFLKNIDLLDEGEGDATKARNQHLINFEEERHSAPWSPLYYGLTNLEALLQSDEEPSLQSILLLKHKSNLKNLLPNLLMAGLHHRIYWIRLGVQRVYGALFSLSMKTGVDVLGEEASEMLYKLAGTFKFKPQLTDELGTQLVKNMTFILKAVISQESANLTKLFSRLSFVARKLMLNVNEAKDKIAHVLLYFQVALHLFSQQHDGELDNPHSRQVLAPILELVYRVYTDEQYADSRAKELALELVDQLSAGIEKSYFIATYNAVKQGIAQKRLERKKQQRILMAGPEGAKIKDQRRQRKQDKKKQLKKEKKLQMELRKK